MKKVLLTTLLCYFISFFSAIGSNSNIYISVAQPDRDGITGEAKKHLEAKLKQILTLNGIANEDESSRFILTSKVLITSKDIIAGPPQKVSMNIDIVLMIGDVVENKIFETISLQVIGVGNNENKAFISALKNIKPKNAEITSFIEQSKTKVIEYYSTRCEQIKTEAKQCAASRNYDEAIYLLMNIPYTNDCFDECQSLALNYFNERLEMQAVQYLNEAKAQWAANPSSEGASNVAEIISRIPANTKHQKEVNALIKEINNKLLNDQRKAWDFKIRQYKDNLEKEKREYDLRAKQQSADNAARTQHIEACRQVKIAYAKNQPKTIIKYYKNIILW